VAAAQPVEMIIGDSPAIREVTSMIRRVAESPATIGETMAKLLGVKG